MRADARSLARWITGPSATGSLKRERPSSMTSAPASIAARGNIPRGGEIRIAAGEIGDESVAVKLVKFESELGSKG